MPVSDALNAIYCHSGCGPAFGSGHDFYISDDSNANISSYSYICSYKPVNNSSINCYFFAGAEGFQVAEIEVFQKS